jgi:glycine betaine/proline transport system substrate-binding protein
MNTNLEMTYLTGGDEWFGPNFGGSTVSTNTRADYVGECPNVGRFLQNLAFTLEMENEIMGRILDESAAPDEAAADWLAANPDSLEPWLEGVTTRDGGDALAATRGALGL